MTAPVEVDPAALQAVARELAALSHQLSGEGVKHETQPAVADQPTGPAVVDLSAAANHVVGECAANLLLFAESVAAAARWYEATDAESSHELARQMLPK
ncbi:type VII secretion target [Mycobacterium sp. 3519A]|uniref:type VII secretion target n=1 Tax=Mycobacterium sp. 3519A TaxID=2057184 RepID=UPI000C7CCBDD|nr:type VII secretion target [Mycobacterium sp. 3519A]